MPNPKRRHSNTRTLKRRTHWKATYSCASICPECKKNKPMHRVCPHCGFYRGKKILEIAQE